MSRILLVGGTGHLGGLLAARALERGAALRLLVRPGRAAQLDPALRARVEISEDEAAAFEGVDAVISAVQGGPETIVDAQLGWLRRAREAGVRRFIPSDYSFDLFRLPEGRNLNSDWRRAFARAAATEAGSVEVVHVLNGCFLDHRVLFGFLGAFDLGKREAHLWGDGQAKMDFTTYADTAAYAVEAALEAKPLGGKFAVAGETLNFAELVAAVEAATGQRLAIVRRGPLEELDEAIARAQKEQPGNPFAWLPGMYWRSMLNGEGRLEELRNADYPAIRPEGVTAYLRRTAAAS